MKPPREFWIYKGEVSLEDTITGRICVVEKTALIAAAPEMLAALEFILSQWPFGTDYAKRRVVAEAIDKARGVEA